MLNVSLKIVGISKKDLLYIKDTRKKAPTEIKKRRKFSSLFAKVIKHLKACAELISQLGGFLHRKISYSYSLPCQLKAFFLSFICHVVNSIGIKCRLISFVTILTGDGGRKNSLFFVSYLVHP